MYNVNRVRGEENKKTKKTVKIGYYNYKYYNSLLLKYLIVFFFYLFFTQQLFKASYTYNKLANLPYPHIRKGN